MAQVPERLAVGTRLREHRKRLGLTLKEVGNAAGFSVGFISQIERGITAPSLSSLVAVSRVLQVHVRDVFEHPKVTAPTTRNVDRLRYSVGGDEVVYERLTTSFPNNILHSTIVHEPPGHRSEPIVHSGEEMFYMLEGALTVEIEGVRTILEVGDSIHFQSTKRHSTWNHTDRTSATLIICTMDVFGDDELAQHEPHRLAGNDKRLERNGGNTRQAEGKTNERKIEANGRIAGDSNGLDNGVRRHRNGRNGVTS